VWGDAEAGEVADWIYASTGKIHCLVFGLGINGVFRHSREFLTVFGADEWLHVLDGTMAIANPETGEVERIPAGGSVFFRKDTWHHAFACDSQPLKVVEFFSPPPSTGASGAYARTRPYLEESRYADDALLGRLVPGAPRNRTLHAVREADLVWRRDLGALVGLACSTEHLTAGHLEVQAGETAVAHAHSGDEVLYVTDGVLHVRAWHGDETRVFELRRDDACFLPEGSRHEYRNYGAATARAVFGVAPSFG
jgi:quercetin dioxygenase-like cupin family protein